MTAHEEAVAKAEAIAGAVALAHVEGYYCQHCDVVGGIAAAFEELARKVVCLYCGTVMVADTPEERRDVSSSHIVDCDKRPEYRLLREIERLTTLINTPETVDFLEGVKLEAAHQRERWAADDVHKRPADWFWTLGFLASKLLHNPTLSPEKRRQHIIAVAALCANWHAHELATSPPPATSASAA